MAASGGYPALEPITGISESTQMTRRLSMYYDDDVEDGFVDELVDAFESLWQEVEHTSAYKRGVPVKVRITSADRDPLHHPVDPVLYTIKMQHGPYQWTVRRRYKHFIKLDSELRLLWLKSKLTRQSNVPLMHLPVRLARRDAKKEQLEVYLQKLMEIEVFRNHRASLRFMEVSRYSFFDDLGKVKGKEDNVRKHGGGYRIELQLCGCDCAGCFALCCCPLISQAYRWTRRWMVIKDSFIILVKQKTGRVSGVMLMDKEFSVMLLAPAAGIPHGIQIHNLSRDLLVQSWSDRQAREWFIATDQMRHGPGSIWTKQQRYDSFAPVRDDSKALWFVDAEDYYSAVADAINSARYEILIAGWWLSPELYLKRNIANMDKWRLDNLLKRKAEAGVKISVLIYKEIPQAMPIQSLHTSTTLMNLHPNIVVLRHPDHRRQGIYYWGHHEKVVCVDQCVSFVGGLDLCYGRWDNPRHVLTDLPRRHIRRLGSGSDECDGPDAGSASSAMMSLPGPGQTPAAELSALPAAREALPAAREALPAVREAGGVADAVAFTAGNSPGTTRSQVTFYSSGNGGGGGSGGGGGVGVGGGSSPRNSRSKRSRMARALTRARHLGWLTRAGTSMEMDVPFTASTKPAVSRGMSVDEMTVQDGGALEYGTPCELCAPNESCWHFYQFPGQDYSNPLVKDFDHVHLPLVDIVKRVEVVRLPWHDVHMCTVGSAASDLARHFIQRWNYAKYTKKVRTQSGRKVDFLLPRHLPMPNMAWMDDAKLHGCEVQIVRSASDWSCGVPRETSILRAYCAAIQNAEHFVYIENQFFISSQLDSSPPVYNPIMETLAERIVLAHECGTEFHCYVVLPLLPGFPGELDAGSGVAKKAILHYILSTISRGDSSLFSRLESCGVLPMNYISFCSLRVYDKLQNKLMTEMVYIHSKLMIVDDRVVIMGSANINDRSMTGDRDTELAAVVRDTEMIPGRLGTKSCEVGRFAHSLRMALFKEHLGCCDEECFDPASQSFFKKVWLSRAAGNTKAFEQVFNCVPNDSVKNISQLQQNRDTPAMKDTDPHAAEELLRSNVRGNLVLFPHQFLADEDLRPPLTSKENLISLTVFT